MPGPDGVELCGDVPLGVTELPPPQDTMAAIKKIVEKTAGSFTGRFSLSGKRAFQEPNINMPRHPSSHSADPK
jgi:hypothetical protein